MQRLLNDTCLELLVRGNAITLTPNSTLADALRVMVDNLIVSVPVVEGDRCVGIVDNVCVLNYLAKQVESVKEWMAFSTERFEETLAAVSLKDVLEGVRHESLIISHQKSNVQSLLKFFSSGSCHRCVVHTSNGFGICSQLDVVMYLSRKLKEMDEIRKTLEDISLADNLRSRSLLDGVITIGKDQMVFEALNIMSEKNVPALAVVDTDRDRQIIGNFSATDLLSLKYCELNELSLSVEQFLLRYSPNSLSPITVEEDATTLANVINLFSNFGVHRLWIVDSESFAKVPIGVVTLTDALKMINNIN
jgi:predicted transcriptional regulator